MDHKEFTTSVVERRYGHAMITILRSLLILLLSLAMPGPARADEQNLQILAHTGPWPVNSAIIGYRGRIWFTNSVKGVNHNSADVWSLDPATGTARYERGLFSQDTGLPVRHRQMLYWPFEDGRAGSQGVMAVTDGTDEWAELLIPEFEAYHLHAMANWRGNLVAATAALHAGLHLSRDQGRTWQVLIDLPPRVGAFVRLDALAVADGRLYARLDEADGMSLVEYRAGALHPLPGWPKTEWLDDPIAVGERVMALTSGGGIWAFDGARSFAIPAPETDETLRGLGGDGTRLFALTGFAAAGSLWELKAAGTWMRRARFQGGLPGAMTLYQGHIYVAGRGDDGRGILWGPPVWQPVPEPAPEGPLPRLIPQKDDATDWAVEFARVAATIADPETYRNHGRGLRDALRGVAMHKPPAGFWTGLLALPMPKGTVATFGGRGNAVRADMARWYLLWSLGLAGEKAVPANILSTPWTRAANSPEKWFDPLLIGLWAAGNSDQDDPQTVAALVARLARKDDPLWLQGQVIATLTAVSGCHFGYDTDAWLAWWQGAHRPCR